MNINKYIGEKIRYFRQSKNINQEELAEYLGVTKQTVSRYELGDRKTDNDILFRLADYFNVSINDFFPPINVKNDNNCEFDILQNFLKKNGFLNDNEKLNEENLSTLIDFVKANKQFIMKDKK